MSLLHSLTDRFGGFLFLMLVIGGINYGLMGAFEYDLLAEVFAGGMVINIVYVLIGVAALLSLDKAFELFHSHK